MKQVFFLLLGFLVFVILARSFIAEYEHEFKIHVMDEYEEDFLGEVTVNITPQLPHILSDGVAGRGTHLYKIDDYKIAYISVQKQGYKSKGRLALLKPNGEYTITMRELDESELKKLESEENGSNLDSEEDVEDDDVVDEGESVEIEDENLEEAS